MSTTPDSVTYSQTISEIGSPSSALDWVSTDRPNQPWLGFFGFATDTNAFEFYDGGWKHPVWSEGGTFSGAVTFGSNTTFNAAAQFNGRITGTFYAATPGTVTWSGSSTDGVTLNPFRMTGVIHTGTTSATEAYLNLLNIAGTDNITTTGKIVGWRFNHNVASGASGSRNGLHYQIATTGPTTGMEFLTSANFFSYVNHSTGGTAYSNAGAVTGAFGLNSYSVIAAGVEYVRESVGFEADVSVRNVNGVYRKAGVQAVLDLLDAGPGYGLDAGLVAAAQEGAYGWKDAYAVTGWTGQNPLRATGITSAFRAYYGTNYSSFGNRAFWGVNIQELDIAGWAFASQNFRVNGNGSELQLGRGILATTATGITLAGNGSIVTAAAVAAGGAGYAVNDILYDDDGAGNTYGGVYRVATLSGSAVATVAVLKSPVWSGSTPANPIATTTWQTTGQGTGCTLNLTWSTGTDVGIGGATDKILMNSIQASTSYANDAAAAAGGVAVGQVYRNGSVVQVRIV